MPRVSDACCSQPAATVDSTGICFVHMPEYHMLPGVLQRWSKPALLWQACACSALWAARCKPVSADGRGRMQVAAVLRSLGAPCPVVRHAQGAMDMNQRLPA